MATQPGESRKSDKRDFWEPRFSRTTISCVDFLHKVLVLEDALPDPGASMGRRSVGRSLSFGRFQGKLELGNAGRGFPAAGSCSIRQVRKLALYGSRAAGVTFQSRASVALPLCNLIPIRACLPKTSPKSWPNLAMSGFRSLRFERVINCRLADRFLLV